MRSSDPGKTTSHTLNLTHISPRTFRRSSSPSPLGLFRGLRVIIGHLMIACPIGRLSATGMAKALAATRGQYHSQRCHQSRGQPHGNDVAREDGSSTGSNVNRGEGSAEYHIRGQCRESSYSHTLNRNLTLNLNPKPKPKVYKTFAWCSCSLPSLGPACKCRLGCFLPGLAVGCLVHLHVCNQQHLSWHS